MRSRKDSESEPTGSGARRAIASAPKLLRYRLLHLPARLTPGQRTRQLHLRADRPRTDNAWRAIKALPTPTRPPPATPTITKRPTRCVEPGARDTTVAPDPAHEQETMIKTTNL
ncbi:MAG: hypothetical protein ACRDT0_11595 [Pseudonocardiaceae bacterium]